jgi:hypothetical protein
MPAVRTCAHCRMSTSKYVRDRSGRVICYRGSRPLWEELLLWWAAFLLLPGAAWLTVVQDQRI